MVQVLASRAAGFRLGLVVVLLLVPFLYFGSVITSNALYDYRLAKANAAAVQLADFTFRDMVDIASGWSVSDQQKELLKTGPGLAELADAKPEFERLTNWLVLHPSDRAVSLGAGHRLLAALSDGALMNDPGNREANSMAHAAAMSLPSVLVNFHELQVLTDGAMHSAARAKQDIPRVDTLAAELAFITREFGMVTGNAKAMSTAPQNYDAIIDNAKNLHADALSFKSILLDESLDPLERMQKVSGALRAANVNWTQNILDNWTKLDERFSALSDKRIRDLQVWIGRTIILAIAATLVSLGLAIRMFNSTLKQLDELETAKKEAEKARFIAESSVTEIAEVNNNLADMNKEVSQHLKALEEAQEQLVKKGRMEQMGQLTATMAHELRNPLGAARTSIFLLERKTRGKELGVESQIQRITNAIMRCDDIITQLLDFSRTKKLSPTSADFDAWLEKIVTDEAMRLPQALSISVELGTAGTPIAFDPSRMQRAITNLLNNASEAMVGTGDDSTKFAVPNPRIDIRSAVVDGQLQLTVADNGPGISAENLARVREPLFTTKSFGTGLGLPAVEQIAAQHGGSMKITSEVGQGTTATILLPLETAQEAA